MVDASAGSGRARSAWIDEQLAGSGLGLDAGARKAIADHIGNEPGRLPGMLATLQGAFGTGAALGRADVEPYLGEAGDVAPWDLTDAIDSGDVPGALQVLRRMLDGGGRHPLQVMATLTNHYLRMIRLDDPGVNGGEGRRRRAGHQGQHLPGQEGPRRRPPVGDRPAGRGGVRCSPRPIWTCTGAKAWPPRPGDRGAGGPPGRP